MITRRLFTAASVALIGDKALAQSFGGSRFRRVRNRPKFGAIRWDAWYSMVNGSVPYELAVNPGTLAPNAWQFRAPVHATVGSNTISWASASQATFDNEILAANKFGLDYWVFDHYAPAVQPTLNVALDFYMSSTQPSRPRLCLMESTGTLGTTGNYSTQIALTLTYIQSPWYMFVKGNRPLIYIYYTTANITSYWGGSNANYKAALDALRSLVQGAGFGNPYLVVITGGVSSGTVPTALGADAYSRYIGPIPSGLNGTFAAMTASVEGYWVTDAAAFSPYVPTCNVGYNPVPLNELPPSFWTPISNSVVEPTPIELTTHFQHGSNFANNPAICDAHTVLVYSWSECAEGGVAMMPTIGDPTGTKGQSLLSVT
jgi:hypothetical protein